MLSRNEPQSRKALALFRAALIGLAIWWVYRPAFHAGWIWDDSLEIYGNYSLRTARGLRNIWFAPPGLDYFPLKSTLQWVQWHLWQGSPGGYHATNVVLHFLSALLLWRVLEKLGIRCAWLGGLLFAVHPLAVETVAWVSEFKNVLSLALVLLAFLAFLKFERRFFNREVGEVGENTSNPNQGSFYRKIAKIAKKGIRAKILNNGSTACFAIFAIFLLKKTTAQQLLPDLPDLPVKKDNSTTAASRSSGKKWYLVSLLMFVLAMLSKSSVVMFPVILLLYGWSRLGPAKPRQGRQGLNRKFFLATVPFFAVSLVLGLVTVWFQMNRALEGTRGAAEGLGVRLGVAGKALVFYFAKAVWPARELAVYPRWEMSGAAEWAWGAAFVGVIAGAIFLLWVERLVPETLVRSVTRAVRKASRDESLHQAQTRQSERLRDEPLHQALARQSKRLETSRSTSCPADAGQRCIFRAILLGAGVFVVNLLPVIGLAPMAYQRISWVADHFVYLPLAGVVGLAAAGADWALGRAKGTARVRASGERRGLETASTVLIGAVVVVLAVRSHSYVRIFQSEKSLWTYTLERNPAAWIGYNNLGIAVRLEGHPQEAIRDYEAALRLRPDFAEAHNDLGVALADEGKFQEALAQYEAAIRDKPDLADAYNDEGNLLQNMGRLPQAEMRLRQALRINPNSPEAHNDFGNVLVRRGHPDEAIPQYQEALRLRPDFVEAMSNLGMTFATLGRIDAAIALYDRALQLMPKYAQAHNNLGVVLARAGHREEAMAQYRLALHYDPQLKEAQANLETLEGGR